MNPTVENYNFRDWYSFYFSNETREECLVEILKIFSDHVRKVRNGVFSKGHLGKYVRAAKEIDPRIDIGNNCILVVDAKTSYLMGYE